MRYFIVFSLVLLLVVSCGDKSADVKIEVETKSPAGGVSDADVVPESLGDSVKPELPPRKIRVSRITPSKIAGKTFFNAVIEAQSDVVVTTKTTGEVERVNFELGEFVKRGDTLAVIEHDLQKAALDQANLTLSQAELTYELRKKFFDRDRALFESNALSKESFDLSENTYKNSELSLNQAKSSLETAKINLNNCYITAPFSGIIAERPAQAGQYLTIGSPVARLVDTKNLQAIVGLTYTDVLSYKKHQKKDVEIILNDGTVIPGIIKGVAEAPDRKSSLYSMKIFFESKEDEATKKRIVFPGMQLKVAVLGKEYENSFEISRSFVRFIKDKYYIFVEEGGKAFKKEVLLLSDLSKNRIVKLADDSAKSFNLIVTGIDALEDGRSVEILEDKK